MNEPACEDIPPNAFRIIVENRHGRLLPQTIPASSLREALTQAYALPLTAWFPDEDQGPPTN